MLAILTFTIGQTHELDRPIALHATMGLVGRVELLRADRHGAIALIDERLAAIADRQAAKAAR